MEQDAAFHLEILQQYHSDSKSYGEAEADDYAFSEDSSIETIILTANPNPIKVEIADESRIL